MQFSKILIPLLPLALAQSPGATQILNSITAIDTAVQSLHSALTAYTGGINSSLPVIAATLNVHQVNRAGYNANQAVQGPLSPADSQQVDKRVSDSVGVSIPAATKVLEDKKPLFDAANLSSLVLSTIELLKYDHETFSLVVGEKLSLGAVPGGLSGAGGIEAVLVGAVAYYSL